MDNKELKASSLMETEYHKAQSKKKREKDQTTRNRLCPKS